MNSLVKMNARDKWLASFASENTRHTYEQVFAAFWESVPSRYSPSPGVDALDWLLDHRRAEVKRGSSDRLHCELLVSEWYKSLAQSDLDASSIITYLAVVRSFFKHLIPLGGGVSPFASQTRGCGVLTRGIILFIFSRDSL